MSFIRRLFGEKGEIGQGTEKAGGTGVRQPILITTRKEDSLPSHIDRIQASGCILPEPLYRGLSLYALRVPGTSSFLSHFQTFLQGAATGNFPGNVMELKPAYGRPVPPKMLLRILGVVSYEGKRRDGDLVILPPGPPEPAIVMAFSVRGDPALTEGEMRADSAMADVLRGALGGLGRLPSEPAHLAISRMCRPGTPFAQLPRLVGMVSESLRGDGIPEPNIPDFMRAYLNGTCPSCHRLYAGEEMVLLCELKRSQRVQETVQRRNPDRFVGRIPGEEGDIYWRLNRLNQGICLNPSCNSGRVDLSWVQRSLP